MRFRTYKNTELTVSEVGFGLWTISTGWWGNFTEGEAIALMQKAFDLGITLFDAADTYGNGLSEELIAKAFPNWASTSLPLNGAQRPTPETDFASRPPLIAENVIEKVS
jgi:aryl-alcohol dehydrogenase-like predicted oxidoreductase